MVSTKRGTATIKLQSGGAEGRPTCRPGSTPMARSNAAAMDMVAGKTEARPSGAPRAIELVARGRAGARQDQCPAVFAGPGICGTDARYDQAVEEVNDALRRNIITEQEHRQVMDQVSASYVQGGRAIGHRGAGKPRHHVRRDEEQAANGGLPGAGRGRSDDVRDRRGPRICHASCRSFWAASASWAWCWAP